MHRVQKLIGNSGFCSRRKAEELIKDGIVKVNGKTISIGDKATDEDIITVNGKLLFKPEKKYIMFNKPVGCVTALTDPDYKTVMDYIHVPERVFPVGRLDFNTSGLLILTNDGDFANKIMHPRYEINKTYKVVIHEALSKKDQARIQAGVKLEDGKTSPAKINILSENIVEITLHEGKNRIVRRIFNSLGYGIRSIHRIKIGKLELKELEPGKYQSFPARRYFTY